jgi:Cytochrome P460
MRRRLKIKLALLSLTVFVIAVSAYSSATRTPVAPRAEADKALESLSAYRKWTLVNPSPVKMESAVATLCAARVPPGLPQSPHQDKFISVYVNETGRSAMMLQRAPQFPVGSMIVKEKLSTKESDAPELLTAMIKREKGYNPQSGDWEYLVLDGAASQLIKRGKLADCTGCHRAYEQTDYVTRTYLTDETRRRLK